MLHENVRPTSRSQSNGVFGRWTCFLLTTGRRGGQEAFGQEKEVVTGGVDADDPENE